MVILIVDEVHDVTYNALCPKARSYCVTYSASLRISMYRSVQRAMSKHASFIHVVFTMLKRDSENL